MDPRTQGLVDRYRVTDGRGFRLDRFDPGDTAGLDLDKEAARAALAKEVAYLAAQQGRLAAQDRWAVLCIFQAMDAAGKDGAIKHVFTGVNPQGCHVASFKAPTTTDLAHDFLWRHAASLPARGQIGIHNRSWYEEVLVARIHPAVLAASRVPAALQGPALFDERLVDIAAFESYLARQGTVILKFFLHVSPEEQRQRLLKRIDDPERNWKFAPSDVTDRAHWGAYQSAYEAAIRATAAPHAPWFVIPADKKWFSRLMVVAALTASMETLDLHYPKPDAAARRALQDAAEALAG